MPHTLLQALRGLSRRPGFTLLAAATLSLGLGATGLVFGLLDNVLLQPLPYPGSERLVRVYHHAPGLGFGDDLGVTEPTYLRMREASVLAGLALYDTGAVNLSAPAVQPERLSAAWVSHSLPAVLGVAPVLGRLFLEEEERPGSPPVVLLGEALWRRSFGARAGVVGERVLVDGSAHEVVGVLPAAAAFPEPETALWLPRSLDPAAATLNQLGIDAVGRLAAGVTAADAEAALKARVEPLGQKLPVEQASRLLTDAGFTTRVVGLREALVGDLSRSLWVLMGGMGLVLLIAGANVANLFLVRAEGREQELAVRAALGAGRRHQATAFLLEGTILGLLGAAGGTGLALLGTRLLVRFGPEQLPRLHEVSLDERGVAFILAAGLALGLALGAVPLLYRGTSLAAVLGGARRGATAQRSRVRSRDLLMSVQVALALVLLVASGLMLRSFRSLSQVDPGFEPRGLLTFDVALPEADYPGDEAAAAFVRRAVVALSGLPGVEAASAVKGLPLRGDQLGASGVSLEDFPEGPGDPPRIHFNSQVAPGLFATLGVPVLAGRDFEDTDHERRTGAVVVNEAFARRYWPAESAVGKRLQPRPGEPEADGWYTIVGVVGDVLTIGLDEPPSPMLYYPLLAHPADSAAYQPRTMTFVLRTATAPATLAAAARERIHELDPHLPVASVQTMERVVARAAARPAFLMAVLAVGAAGALLIGAIGIYGVVSYLVGRRRREFGIRLAVGARPTEIAALVLRRCLWITGAGAVAGILLAVLVTRLMRSLLFGVEPLDMATFAGAVPALVTVALLAAYLPARRAARVDPLTALRTE